MTYIYNGTSHPTISSVAEHVVGDYFGAGDPLTAETFADIMPIRDSDHARLVEAQDAVEQMTIDSWTGPDSVDEAALIDAVRDLTRHHAPLRVWATWSDVCEAWGVDTDDPCHELRGGTPDPDEYVALACCSATGKRRVLRRLDGTVQIAATVSLSDWISAIDALRETAERAAGGAYELGAWAEERKHPPAD